MTKDQLLLNDIRSEAYVTRSTLSIYIRDCSWRADSTLDSWWWDYGQPHCWASMTIG